MLLNKKRARFRAQTKPSPSAIQRDRGAIRGSEFLPNCLPRTFCRMVRPESGARGVILLLQVTRSTTHAHAVSVDCDISREVCRVLLTRVSLVPEFADGMDRFLDLRTRFAADA